MTPKQQKLINIITENYRDKKTTKTLKKMLLEAGYTTETSEQAIRILESKTIQDKLSPIVDKLNKKRDKALKFISDEKLKKSSARDLSGIVDVLTKNSQLLSGKETEKAGITIEVVDYDKDNNSP